MADIKTMTEEVEELQLNIVEVITGAEYEKLAEVLSKVVEKLDEIIIKINT